MLPHPRIQRKATPRRLPIPTLPPILPNPQPLPTHRRQKQSPSLPISLIRVPPILSPLPSRRRTKRQIKRPPPQHHASRNHIPRIFRDHISRKVIDLLSRITRAVMVRLKPTYISAPHPAEAKALVPILPLLRRTRRNGPRMNSAGIALRHFQDVRQFAISIPPPWNMPIAEHGKKEERPVGPVPVIVTGNRPNQHDTEVDDV